MDRVRRATSDDLPRLLEMGARFARETVYRDHLQADPARIKALAEQLVAGVAGQGSAVWVAQDPAGGIVGMIGMFVYEHPLSGERIASEVFWWVDPEHRRGGHALRLLESAEKWARWSNATTLYMIAPTPDVARIYERRGYAQLETTYARAL